MTGYANKLLAAKNYTKIKGQIVLDNIYPNILLENCINIKNSAQSSWESINATILQISFNFDNLETRLEYHTMGRIAVIIAIPFLLLFVLQLRSGMRYNRVVRVLKAHGEISIDDLATETRIEKIKVKDILYDVIKVGGVRGIIKEDTFVPAAPKESRFRTAIPRPKMPTSSSPEARPEMKEKIITERVLVICRFCGAKTEQGLSKCQNCQADL